MNEATDKIYVVNRCGSDRTCASAGRMTVIDGPSNNTINLETGPAIRAVAVNPETNRIFVVNATSNTISVFDGATNLATAVEIAGPAAIAVNSATNRIYVAARGNKLAVIDGANNAITIVPLASEAAALSVNPVTNQIYLLSPAGKSISVVDGATNDINTLPAAHAPISAAVNPVTNQFYVAAINSNDVALMDGVTNSFAAVTVNASLPSPANSEVPVASATMSADEAAPVRTIIAPIASPVSGTPAFAFTAAGSSSTTASATASAAQGVFFKWTRSRDRGPPPRAKETASPAPLLPRSHPAHTFSTLSRRTRKTQVPPPRRTRSANQSRRRYLP